MAGIKVELDDKQVKHAFSNLADIDMAEALGGIGETLLNNTRERLDKGVDVNGKPFTPLSDLTKLLKQKNKDKILIAGGDLYRELAWQLVNGGNGLEFGSDREYAALQQLGGTIVSKSGRALRLGGKDSEVFAKSVTIPARPFIGITPKDEDEILDNLAGFIEQQLA